jgi:hypothetical protein
LQFFV